MTEGEALAVQVLLTRLFDLPDHEAPFRVDMDRVGRRGEPADMPTIMAARKLTVGARRVRSSGIHPDDLLPGLLRPARVR